MGGGEPTLTHVDKNKAQNGGYGYLGKISWSRAIAVPNHICQLENVSYGIVDYTKYSKYGTLTYISGWKLTGLEADPTKIVLSNNSRDIGLLIMRSNTVNGDAILTFTKNGFSFRAKVNFQYKNGKVYYTIKEPLIRGDNQALYDELYKNADWLV